MMPCESWNASQGARLRSLVVADGRMERASARTMRASEETCVAGGRGRGRREVVSGKKDWGEARPSPYLLVTYWVESCVPSLRCRA